MPKLKSSLSAILDTLESNLLKKPSKFEEKFTFFVLGYIATYVIFTVWLDTVFKSYRPAEEFWHWLSSGMSE